MLVDDFVVLFGVYLPVGVLVVALLNFVEFLFGYVDLSLISVVFCLVSVLFDVCVLLIVCYGWLCLVLLLLLGWFDGCDNSVGIPSFVLYVFDCIYV